VAEAQYQNPPVDKRRLSKQDRSDFKRGNERQENRRHKRVRARIAAKNWREGVPENTTAHRPNPKKGFLKGPEIQQMRMRQAGQEKRRSKALRTME
jgi:hypothetical protein